MGVGGGSGARRRSFAFKGASSDLIRALQKRVLGKLSVLGWRWGQENGVEQLRSVTAGLRCPSAENGK